MTRPMAPMAAEKRREEKKETWSMGWLERFSQTQNTASTATAAPMEPRMAGDVQERSGASMIPHNSKPMPKMERPAPTGSAALVLGSLEFGTIQRAAMNPNRAMGTLTRNTEPHQKWSRSQPPATGPMATPSPVVPDHTPIALDLSRASEKVLVSMERVEGMMADPPIPMNPRAAMSPSGLPEKADRAEPAAKMSNPAMKTHLRPRRSPRLPATRSSPAKTIAYESTIHWSELEEACRVRTITGKATLRIVLSRLTMRRLTHSTARTARRFGRRPTAVVSGGLGGPSSAADGLERGTAGRIVATPSQGPGTC